MVVAVVVEMVVVSPVLVVYIDPAFFMCQDRVLEVVGGGAEPSMTLGPGTYPVVVGGGGANPF